MKKAAFYKALDDKSVACGLCPHCCKILPDKRGLCGVRHNQNGTLIAESYGRITSMALDPIEKKPLYHFYPGAKILSLGSYGCNFRCGFCQNHEISMRQAAFRELSPEDVAAASRDAAPKGNIGVAYTYNEPFISYEFVADCARLIVAQGQKNVLVTNGFICKEPLAQLLPFLHAMNIDLKSFRPEFYREIGGRLEDVQHTITFAAPRCHLEVTTLIIPGKNDCPEEMRALSQWLATINPDIPLHISRFFPAHKMRDIPATPVKTVLQLVEVARQNLRYVYPGNI